VPHNQQDEYYVCIYSHREGETILFHHEGGVDIGDVDAKALKLTVAIDDQLKVTDLTSKLLVNVANQKRKE
jgi:ATP citrate (pro-S)-lyase